MNRKIVVIASLIFAALVLGLLFWYLYRYDTTILSLSYESSPTTSSPLSAVSYSWEAKAYSARVFGNSPFDGKGYAHRTRTTSENRFGNTEFHNLNVTLRLRFEIKNGTGHVLCNQTFQDTDGRNRQVTFEFKPESLKAGNNLEIKIILNLNVNYEYGANNEPKQFTLQKEWTRTIQVHQTEPEQGVNF